MIEAPKDIALNAPMVTFPPVVALGARLEKSSITQSCSREVLVFKMQKLPTLLSLLTMTPPINTEPSPMVTPRAIWAEGGIAGTNLKFGETDLTFSPTRCRVQLSPMETTPPYISPFPESPANLPSWPR